MVLGVSRLVSRPMCKEDNRLDSIDRGHRISTPQILSDLALCDFPFDCLDLYPL
jgi:hypothetical protein